MARDELDALKDQLYVLHCAVVDARADLESDRLSVDALRELLEWVLEAAEPVAQLTLPAK